MKICLLSQDFYNSYKNASEILKKQNRPYAVFLIELYGLKFAIPFRGNINKNNKDCFITDNNLNAGLDFQKSVVITKEIFIDKNVQPQIRNVDYMAILFRDNEIKQKFLKYLNFYKKEILRQKNNPNIKINARIHFSSLQYFHKELGL